MEKNRTVYNTLSLEQKIQIIELNEKNVKVKDLCEKFQCGKTQVYSALKRKEELKEEWTRGASYYKRKKSLENEDIDSILWTWFVDACSKKLLVSGSILQSKALEIAEKLGKTNFKASNGWLVSFKNRHNISCKVICDETKEAVTCSDVLTAWKENLQSFTRDYKPRDIFNGDESGLFFRALPANSSSLKGEKCKNGKFSKERLTVFLCCNMIGEVETPLVVGKASKPRCFKNLNIKKLPVLWKTNKKSWMTAKLMEEWLHSFNNKMKKQNRAVLLLLDNAACHPHIQLSNVTLVWLPNDKSVTQPLDQGVIYMMKLKYRQLLLQSLTAKMSTNNSVSKLTKSITVLDAVNWLSQAYNDILPETITKCFKNAGFFIEIDEEVLDSIDEPLQCTINNADLGEISASDYVNIDNEVSTEAGIQSLDELVAFHDDEQNDSEEEDDDDDADGEEIEIENPCKTYKDALIQIQHLQNFCLQTGNSNLMEILSRARCEIEKCIVKKKS